MNDGLYTNRSARRDFVKNALDLFSARSSSIYVAVAFFTEDEPINEMLKCGSHVRLVVRLGFPTSPKALYRLMSIANLEIRYFTNPAFHPKLFIFGSEVALVGSANLTNAAVMTNQEIMLCIRSDDDRFGELALLFSEYWDDAKVLTTEVLEMYQKLYDKRSALSKDIHDFDNEVLSSIGNVVAGNISRGLKKESSESIFLESYRKTYQECITAFDVIRSVYEGFGRRKVNESDIPLRLEIDSFVSFVRERHANGEIWASEPLISGEPQREKIKNLVAEWLEEPWPYFETTIIKQNYPKIREAFASPASINTLDADGMFDALTVVHSFRERLRFYPGGLETLRKEFIAANDLAKVKESLGYLVFGRDDPIKRLANVIFNPKYKPNVFGQANAQELLGWVGKEELPVINGRTTKVLRFFGFDVRQLS